MTDFEPDDAQIRRMLAGAERESERNSGADEFAARAATLRARSRRAASLSIRFDMIATAFLAVVVLVLAIVFHAAFSAG
jgi:hypothetical protein